METVRIFSGVDLDSTSVASGIPFATILKKPSDWYGQLREKPPLRKTNRNDGAAQPNGPGTSMRVD